MSTCRLPRVSGLYALALACLMLAAPASAKTFFFEGSVSHCTGTCDSFLFLAIGSILTGSVEIDDAAIATGTWTGADISDFSFTVANASAANVGPSSPPDPVTDNPFTIDPSAEQGGLIIGNGQSITNPRGSFPSRASGGLTDGINLTSGFIDMWVTQGVLANNGAIITLEIDNSCVKVTPAFSPPCFEVNIFEGLSNVSAGNFGGVTDFLMPSPASLQFGSLQVGANSAQTFTLTNPVGAAISVTGAVVSGTDMADFAVSSNTCVAPLGLDESCAITVLFTPASGGTKSASLDVTFQDPDGTDQSRALAMQGSGSEVPTPNISVAPATVSFGQVDVGSSDSADFAVSNAGTADLEIFAIDADPLNAPFAFASDGCTGAVLAPGDSCTISVSFSPTAASATADSFRISSDDPNTPFAQVDVSGEGFQEAPETAAPGSLTQPPPPDALADPGGGCFIATAAWGSYLDPHVKVLRVFRDRVLLNNRPGRAFVEFYYANSPPIADAIAGNEWLRAFTRWLLTPLVMALAFPLYSLAALIMFWSLLRMRRHVFA